MKTNTLLLLGAAVGGYFLYKKKQADDAAKAGAVAQAVTAGPTPTSPGAVPFIADAGNGTSQIAAAAASASAADTGTAPAQFIDDQGYEVVVPYRNGWGPSWGSLYSSRRHRGHR
jgi:hypothetical protein